MAAFATRGENGEAMVHHDGSVPEKAAAEYLVSLGRMYGDLSIGNVQGALLFLGMMRGEALSLLRCVSETENALANLLADEADERGASSS